MQSVFEKLALREENPGVFAGEWRGGGAASVRTASDEDYQNAVARAKEAFEKWRKTPGPVRGETVRRLGNALRELKHELGQLVTLETGKIIAEGEGEVQEMIDICDFGVGQSRMLYGLTIQSERPSHRRRNDLEAFRKNAADCNCGYENCRTCLPRDGRQSSHLYVVDRRPEIGRPKIG